jgi:hypothetical protein
MSCHIFSRSAYDPVDEAEWSKENSLRGTICFLKAPILPPRPCKLQIGCKQVLQLFKPHCVFATHSHVQQLYPRTIPDWSGMHVNRRPAKGSSLEYEETYDHHAKAPMCDSSQHYHWLLLKN